MRWYKILNDTPTAFMPSVYDKFEFESLALFSTLVSVEDERHLRKYGRSLVQDAFYAIQGVEPDTSDSMGNSWTSVLSSPQMGNIQALAHRSRESLAASVITLAAQVEDALEQLGESPSAEPAPETEHDPANSEFGSLIAGSLADAETTADDLVMFIESVSIGLEGAPPKRFNEAMRMSERFNLREFAAILGFVKSSVHGAARSSKGGSDEMTGYESGGLNDRVLPTQMIKLARGDKQTLIAMAEETLTRRVYRSSRPAGKGPVILLRDESDSMAGADLQTRHLRAQLFELALASVFNKEGRDLVCVRWSSKVAIPFVHGEPGLANHLSGFLCGGTNHALALQRGVEIAQQYVDGADILMLTDAMVPAIAPGQKQMEAGLAGFRASGGRVWAVVFDVKDPELARSRMAWCDGCVAIDKLGINPLVGHMLGEIAKSSGSGKRNI